MYEVKVIKNGVAKFGSTFTTESEAKAWVTAQEAKGSWGKKEVIMLVAEILVPMELIEEVKGPMGIPAFKVRLPADYEVIIEEIKLDPIITLKEIQKILLATDWLFIADVPLDKEYRFEYKRYRQYLRDLRHNSRVDDFEFWLRRTSPEHFLEGRRGPKMVKKFNTYLGE